MFSDGKRRRPSFLLLCTSLKVLEFAAPVRFRSARPSAYDGRIVCFSDLISSSRFQGFPQLSRIYESKENSKSESISDCKKYLVFILIFPHWRCFSIDSGPVPAFPSPPSGLRQVLYLLSTLWSSRESASLAEQSAQAVVQSSIRSRGRGRGRLHAKSERVRHL